MRTVPHFFLDCTPSVGTLRSDRRHLHAAGVDPISPIAWDPRFSSDHNPRFLFFQVSLPIASTLPWSSLSMSTEPQGGPGLGDLEKELTCSVSAFVFFFFLFLFRPSHKRNAGRPQTRYLAYFLPLRPCSFGRNRIARRVDANYRLERFDLLSLSARSLTSTLDLHRFALSAAHPPRLSSYFLWILFERVVLHSSISSIILLRFPIHLPLMSCESSRDSSKCYRHDTPGHGADRQPRACQTSRRTG